MKIKAVIFDLDGTLLNTLVDICLCVNVALKRMGEPTRTQEEVKGMIGHGVRALCEKALKGSDEDRIERMKNLMLTHYSENPNRETFPFPGVQAMLGRLKSMGIRLAVLSNKVHDLTQKLVELNFDDHLFDLVLGQQDSRPPKPDPKGLFEIMKVFGFDPDDMLYVGDSAVDMETGKAAGVRTMGVTWGFRPREELIGENPDFLVDRSEEIVPVVKNLV